MLTLVVARYNEDVSWVNLIPANVFIVNKAQIGNTGREASSYLWFIATHYHALQGDYLFCQGDPLAHCPDFIERVNELAKMEDVRCKMDHNFGPRLTCDWDGAPHHPGLDIEMIFDLICAEAYRDLDVPKKIEFTPGAQFLRSAQEIRAVWDALGRAGRMPFVELERIANTQPQAPWVFERLWDYLIPINK